MWSWSQLSQPTRKHFQWVGGSGSAWQHVQAVLFIKGTNTVFDQAWSFFQTTFTFLSIDFFTSWSSLLIFQWSSEYEIVNRSLYNVARIITSLNPSGLNFPCNSLTSKVSVELMCLRTQTPTFSFTFLRKYSLVCFKWWAGMKKRSRVGKTK